MDLTFVLVEQDNRVVPPDNPVGQGDSFGRDDFATLPPLEEIDVHDDVLAANKFSSGDLGDRSDDIDNENTVDKNPLPCGGPGATHEPSDDVENDNKADKNPLLCGGPGATDEQSVGQSTGGEDFLQSQSAVADSHGNYPKLLFRIHDCFCG